MACQDRRRKPLISKQGANRVCAAACAEEARMALIGFPLTEPGYWWREPDPSEEEKLVPSWGRIAALIRSWSECCGAPLDSSGRQWLQAALWHRGSSLRGTGETENDWVITSALMGQEQFCCPIPVRTVISAKMELGAGSGIGAGSAVSCSRGTKWPRSEGRTRFCSRASGWR